MPDVVPVLVHEAAVHIPNLGIASIGGNIDPEIIKRALDGHEDEAP